MKESLPGPLGHQLKRIIKKKKIMKESQIYCLYIDGKPQKKKRE